MRDMYATAELEDARHVIDWITSQVWCNGHVADAIIPRQVRNGQLHQFATAKLAINCKVEQRRLRAGSSRARIVHTGFGNNGLF